MHFCWSCKSPLPAEAGAVFFCSACGVVQPLACETTLFAALGVPVTFALDLAVLEQAYLTAQRQLHPDRLKDRSAREQLYAEQHAMGLNEAYTILRDPERRGRHLLDCLGHPAAASGETVQDPEILMESLEQREALLDADSAAAVQALAATNRQQQQTSEARIAAAFAAHDLQAAARELLRLRYLCKFADAIKDRQRQVLML